MVNRNEEPTTILSGPQLFQGVGYQVFNSYPRHLPTYLFFLVDFLEKTNLPTFFNFWANLQDTRFLVTTVGPQDPFVGPVPSTLFPKPTYLPFNL